VSRIDTGRDGPTQPESPPPTPAAGGGSAAADANSVHPNSGQSSSGQSSSGHISTGHASPLLGKAVRSVFSVTLLSRIAGLVREVLIARTFGATAVGSAFTFAFAAPNLFRRLFGEGALSAAFVPQYAVLIKNNPQAAALFSLRTVRWLAVTTTVLSVIIATGALAALFFAPGDPERTLSLRLLAVMILYMPLVCLTAILAGMLQMHGRFGAAASGPVVLNTFMVVVAGYYLWMGQTAGETVAYVLAIATVLSGLTQSCTFWWILRRLGHEPRWSTEPVHREIASVSLATMVRKFVPVLIGMGTLQLNVLLDQLIAMWPNLVGPTILGRAYPLTEASNILLANAQRIYQFPLGVFGIAVATAVFPLLARTAGDAGAFNTTLKRGLRVSLLLGLPASVGLALVRADASFVLYGGKLAADLPAEAIGHVAKHVSYTAKDLATISAVLLACAPAVWVYSINHVLTRAFYALGDTTTPMRVGLWMVGLNFLLNITLIWPLAEAGLALATTISAVMQMVVLMAILSKRPGGAAIDRATVIGGLKIALATAIMAGACAAVLWAWPEATTWRSALARLAIVSITGMASFGAAALALKLAELRWLMARGNTPVIMDAE